MSSSTPSSAVASTSLLPHSCPWALCGGPWVWALCVPVVGVLTADEAGLMEAASVALDLLCVVRRLLTGSALGSSAPVWHPGNGRRVPMVWWDYTLLCYPVQSIRTCLSNVRNLSNEARISHRRSEDISLCFEGCALLPGPFQHFTSEVNNQLRTRMSCFTGEVNPVRFKNRSSTSFYARSKVPQQSSLLAYNYKLAIWHRNTYVICNPFNKRWEGLTLSSVR